MAASEEMSYLCRWQLISPTTILREADYKAPAVFAHEQGLEQLQCLGFRDSPSLTPRRLNAMMPLVGCSPHARARATERPSTRLAQMALQTASLCLSAREIPRNGLHKDDAGFLWRICELPQLDRSAVWLVHVGSGRQHNYALRELRCGWPCSQEGGHQAPVAAHSFQALHPVSNCLTGFEFCH